MILLLFLVLPAAYAQQKGVAEGRVVNGTDPSIIVRSVELDIVELDAGMRIVKTATTDSSGRFRVEGLPESGRLMIRVSYKDVNYHRQFNPGANGRSTVEIEVYEPTTSMKDIEAGESRMAFQMAGDQLRSLESVTFNNKTKPPRTFMNPEGNFRFSKPPGIVEPPEVRVTAPGSAMPLVQAPLESPDGQSYYSLYPLRPGVTSFEVQQVLPYSNHTYAYRKKFYVDVDSMDIAVMPKDMVLSGTGIDPDIDGREAEFFDLPERADQSRHGSNMDIFRRHCPFSAGSGGSRRRFCGRIKTRLHQEQSSGHRAFVADGFCPGTLGCLQSHAKRHARAPQSPDRRFEEPAGAIVERNRGAGS